MEIAYQYPQTRRNVPVKSMCSDAAMTVDSPQRRWAKRNPEKIEAWMASIMAKPSASCYWCGASVSKSNLHFDHIVALSKGGPHSIENLCVSCAPCNLSKANKDVVAWVRVGQQVLSL